MDYISWIEDALRRKPHLNQSGLARHLGRHRSVISAMMNGRRSLKAKEIELIAAYLGEAPPGQALNLVDTVPIIGRLGDAWYEVGRQSVPLGVVSPVLSSIGERQIAFVADSSFAGIPGGAVVIAVPTCEGRHYKKGQLVVLERKKAGFSNLSLTSSPPDAGDGEVIAVVIEVRISYV
jgi:hypothetical protein